MKISGAMDKAGVAAVAGDVPQRAANARSASKPNGDQVQLSGIGQELSLGLALLHAAKVSSLASAVATGAYAADPKLVSASMIENSLMPGRFA